jgi:RNA polymerase sigma-70 factor (ECF subfamily)
VHVDRIGLDVLLRADEATVQLGAVREVRGADAVAETFSGRARAAEPALIDGVAGAVWAMGGQPRVVFRFTITDGRITGIEMLADPARLRGMDLQILDE